MATNFPVALDSIANPIASNTLNSPSHASQHTNANDAIEAIQAKVGVDNSAVTTSLDYKVRVWNPVGEITMWATNTAPTGWLICDGTPVSRSIYAALHNLMEAAGYPYGAGDGSTTFNLPNLKGRVVVGRDSADADWNDLGETRGSKTHALTISEMPSHTHIQDPHYHGITDNGHSHTYDQWVFFVGQSFVSTFNTSYNTGAFFNQPSTNSQTTGITINNATATNQNTGGGQAHNNIQPSIVLNFIIRH